MAQEAGSKWTGSYQGKGISEVSGRDKVLGSVGFLLQGLETHRLRTTGLTMGCIHILLDGLYLGDPPPDSPGEGVITMRQGLLQCRARVS